MMKRNSAGTVSVNDPQGGFRDSARWWEPRRILYNAVVGTVFVALTARTWPRLQPQLTSEAVLPLIVLALLANLCYCVGYLADAPVQLVQDAPTRNRLRWALWLAGTLFSVAFETYWFLDEILPPLG